MTKTSSTTKLPQILLEQIGVSECSHEHHRRQHSRSRKDARKQERTLRKQKKARHFSQTIDNKNLKQGVEEEYAQLPKTKKLKLDHISEEHSNSRLVPPPKPNSTSNEEGPDIPAKLLKAPDLPRVRSRIDEDEDAYIAILESKLGLRKVKILSDNDGLDDLLDFAESIAPRIPLDYHEDRGDENKSEISHDENGSQSEFPSDWKGITALESDDSDAEPDSNASVGHHSIEREPKTSSEHQGQYIPPHLRVKGDRNFEKTQKLTRQLKGLLNRMSEQNMTTIVNDVEELYRNHSRHDVTSALTTLVITSISSHSSLLDSFVVLYAAFVATMHKVVGVEFAANFVQHAVASYEQVYSVMQPVSSNEPQARGENQQQDGKECSNLLVLISELYNFQVVSSVLVFDVIRVFLQADLTEFKVELLLKLLRNSGQQLRQDDPSALKDIIKIVQSKVASQSSNASSRTTFMIETLTNLKNNKLKRNVTQNQGGAAVERMKKFLTNLSKTRHVLAHEPLRVSLEDIRLADKKGKWWLVDAAWCGDPLIEKRDEFAKKSSENEGTHEESANLAKLARAQGMNTEIRRAIFIVLMSSEDYVDACERLSQLSLTEVQQREIVRVILHCCGNESIYNPYYTLVCQQLCRTSHSFKITLQYCMWDFLRDLGEANVGGAAVIKNHENNEVKFELQSISQVRLHNVAKSYGWWIAKDSINLLVLKPVDFTVLKPRTRDFLTEVFTTIFVNCQRSTPLVAQDMKGISFIRNRNAIEEIFVKASRIKALAMGIVYFISEILKGQKSPPEDGVSKYMEWAMGVAQDTLRTGIDVVTTL